MGDSLTGSLYIYGERTARERKFFESSQSSQKQGKSRNGHRSLY